MLGPRWTAAEDAAVGPAYAAGGIHAACAAVPTRTLRAILARVQVLGVERKRRWTLKDDFLLRKLWDGGTPLTLIANTLKRTENAAYARAHVLGLELGCPEGWERLTRSAERTGFRLEHLRRILNWAGLKPRRTISPESAPRGSAPLRDRRERRRANIVWPAEVDEAIAAWLDSEPLNTAARRAGVTSHTLRQGLSAIGVRKPDRRHWKQWRVSSADVDRALGRRLEQDKAA